MDNQTKKLLLLALSGDAAAQNDLGCAYSSGLGVEQNFAEAIKWWRKAADLDLPGAALNLGIAYLSGQGVPQDYTEAARWNRKAAEQGLAGAEHNLGNAYFKGQGVPQNYVEAVKWYRRAAYQGLAASQYSLGLAYANGNGVGQDYLEAARWYLKSAEQGDVDAQYNLAGLYAQGLGVAQDLAEAEKWWIKAAAQGDDQAKKCLQALYSAAAGQNSSGRSPAGSHGYSGDGNSGQNTRQGLGDSHPEQNGAGDSSVTPDPKYYSDRQYSLLSPVGWFTTKGRIGVAQFWSRLMIWSLLCFLFFETWLWWTKHNLDTSMKPGVLVGLVLVVFFISGYFSILIRRCHDHNWDLFDTASDKAGWVVVCCVISMLILHAVIIDPNVIFEPNVVIPGKHGRPGLPIPDRLAQLFGAGLVLVDGYFLLKIGCSKGTDGSNRYGPAPTK